MKLATLPDELSERANVVRTKVATNLRNELKSQRWSQRAAANALGLTPRYVNSRATGAVDLSASDLEMFADFLDVPVSHFFGDPGTKSSKVFRINSNHRTLIQETGEAPQDRVSPPVAVHPLGLEPRTH